MRNDAVDHARHVEAAVGRRGDRVRREDVRVGRDDPRLADRVGERCAGHVDLATAAGGVVRCGERRVVAVDARLAARARDVDPVLRVDPDAARRADRDVELAVTHLPGVEGREPEDELSVGGARRLVADVARHEAPVGEEAAAVVLGVVDRALVGRRELADLCGAQVAHRVAVQLEEAPALQRVWLVRVLAGDEPVRAVGVEADLRIDVATGVGLVALARDHDLVDVAVVGFVGVEAIRLGAEDEDLPWLVVAAVRVAAGRDREGEQDEAGRAKPRGKGAKRRLGVHGAREITRRTGMSTPRGPPRSRRHRKFLAGTLAERSVRPARPARPAWLARRVSPRVRRGGGRPARTRPRGDARRPGSRAGARVRPR